MKVPQISVFLENRAGRLHAIAALLGENGINIRSLSLADTSDFGILRLIVDRPEKAEKLLREHHFTVNVAEVVAIEVPDRPGGLAQVLKTLQDAGINIEYMYAFVEKQVDRAVVIFRFDEPDRVMPLLGNGDLRVLTRQQVLGL